MTADDPHLLPPDVMEWMGMDPDMAALAVDLARPDEEGGE